MSTRSNPYYAVKISQTLKKSHFFHFLGSDPVLYRVSQRALGHPVRVRPKNGKKLRLSPPASNQWLNRFRSATTLLSCVFPHTWFVIKVRQLLKKRNFWKNLGIPVRGPPPYGYHCILCVRSIPAELWKILGLLLICCFSKSIESQLSLEQN